MSFLASKALWTPSRTRNVWLDAKLNSARQNKDGINVQRCQQLAVAKFSRVPSYKTAWTIEGPDDMWFIVTVVQNNMLKSLWSEWEWKKKGIDNVKAAFKVLYFLKSSYYIMGYHPPGYPRSHLSGDGSC